MHVENDIGLSHSFGGTAAVLAIILPIELLLNAQLYVHSGKKERTTSEGNYKDVWKDNTVIRQSMLMAALTRKEGGTMPSSQT